MKEKREKHVLDFSVRLFLTVGTIFGLGLRPTLEPVRNQVLCQCAIAWLRGFRVKIANFSRLHCLAIPKRDLNSKKSKPNIEKWLENLAVMLEF